MIRASPRMRTPSRRAKTCSPSPHPSDAVKKREAFADTETLLIGPAQSRGSAMLAAGFLGEFGRPVETVHRSVIADRNVGIRALDDRHRIAGGNHEETSKQERRKSDRQRARANSCAAALLPPTSMTYIEFMIFNAHDLPHSAATDFRRQKRPEPGRLSWPGGFPLARPSRGRFGFLRQFLPICQPREGRRCA